MNGQSNLINIRVNECTTNFDFLQDKTSFIGLTPEQIKKK